MENVLNFYTKEKSRNKYDLFLIVLISSLAFGNLGGQMQPIRILIIGLLPYLLYNTKTSDFLLKNSFFFLFFFLLLLTGSISSLFSINKLDALKELISVFLSAILFFEIIIFSISSKSALKSFVVGWIIFFLLTFPIAVYEIVTDNHLPSSHLDQGKQLLIDGIVVKQFFAAVTFGNRNASMPSLLIFFLS